MNTPKTISEIEREFNKQFVKNIGRGVEPIIKDPNGSVGPIRAFIRQSINEIIDSIPLEEMDITGKTQDDVAQKQILITGYNLKTREIKEWRDNLLK
jgi:hypothetical protein